MSTEINVDEWKAGTEALALCMICGAEYKSGTRECPDCHVSLSVVRRCPSCNRIVSAQHTKCVYCRTPFTHELPENLVPAEEEANWSPRTSKGEQRLRAAAVSIVTFVVVFILGLIFWHQANRVDIPIRIIARSYLLRPTELRHAPSKGSAIVDKVAGGTTVNLTGYREGEQGQRWIALDWNNTVAYVAASELAPPKSLDTDEGANVLKFYLLGMEPEGVDEAVKAVDYYARAFPGDVHGEELRWILADRLRYLSQHGGSEDAALRRQAHQQFEQIEASNGRFAGKAHEALVKFTSTAAPESSPRHPGRKEDELQVVGGSGTRTSIAKSSAHEVLVLNRAEVIVHAGTQSQLSAGAIVSGRVANPVKTNGIVAIPAGAACQLTVLRADPSEANISLGLTSIEIDHRAYAVKSLAVETPSGKGTTRTVDRALVFHLDAPLVIER